MSELTTTTNNKAKEQRKPRSSRSNRDRDIPINHHQSKDAKDTLVFVDKKKEDVIKTELNDTKYGKKEIENNWNKYETKMKTYEEFEKKKNMGANYEELSKTPFGGANHFQFKHEKTNYDNRSTEYNKHFQFDIDILSAGLLSLPFFERNSIDKSIFRPGEIDNMIHRSTKFANKYKSMAKRKSDVVNADANTKFSDTSEPCHEPSEGTACTEMEMIPNKTAVMVGVKPETSKCTLLKNDATHIYDLDADRQPKIVKNIENIPVDTILTKENIMIDPPNQDRDENPPSKSTEDLEKWLDDFLEDS